MARAESQYSVLRGIFIFGNRLNIYSCTHSVIYEQKHPYNRAIINICDIVANSILNQQFVLATNLLRTNVINKLRY